MNPIDICIYNIWKETNKNDATTDNRDEQLKRKKIHRQSMREKETERRKNCHENPKERKIYVIVMRMHKNVYIIINVICDV